jgi:3-hydroxybutyryl-CoA dehydratase
MSTVPNAVDRSFESLRVGETCTRTHTITAEHISAFAAISGDHNPLHMDESYAAVTQFKKPLVHGMFLGALVSELVGMHLPGMRCLLVKETLEFKLPVFVGDTVHIEGTLAHKSEVARILEIHIRILRDADTVAEGTVHTRVI